MFGFMGNTVKHLVAWGKTKSPILALAGREIAGLVDPLFDLLRALGGTKHASPEARGYADELAVFPGNEVWAGYYRDPGKLCRDFFTAFLSAIGFGEDDIENILGLISYMISFDDVMKEISAAEWEAGIQSLAQAQVEEEGQNITATLSPLLRAMSESHSRQLAGEADPEPPGGYMELMRCPAVKFMLRVFLPCAASFQTTPGVLLQYAADGDERALERLLSIDKHALFLPEIAAIYHDRMAKDFKRCQNTINKYLSKSQPVVTKRKLKQALGTFLYVLMGDFDKRLRALDDTELAAKARELNTLTITEIQELFTAFARDSGTIASHETDSDVDDADAFRQAIHRTKKELPSVLPSM